MAIVLGKDCAVNIGGVVGSARQVTIQRTARTIDVDEFGSRIAAVYSTGYDTVLSLEFVDSADAAGFAQALREGQQLSVTSSGGDGLAMPAVVTSYTENQPIDGIVTWTVEAKLCRDGLAPTGP